MKIRTEQFNELAAVEIEKARVRPFLKMVPEFLYRKRAAGLPSLPDPDAAQAEVHRTSLEEVRGEMSSALESYGKQLSPAEMPPFDALKADLARYWETLRPALTWSPEERRRRAQRLAERPSHQGGRFS